MSRVSTIARVNMVHYVDKSFHAKAKKSFTDTRDKKRPRTGFFSRKFTEFCRRTDLHGYKYIVMKDLNSFERGCWALAVLASTACAAYFVVTAYRWYARNPIVTVIESTQGAIWDIPFPAVTICNLNVISRKAARKFANEVLLPANVSADEAFEAIRYAPLLHGSYQLFPMQRVALHKLQAVLELNSVTVKTMFQKLSPASSCNQLLRRCMWKSTIYRCEVLFQQVFTYFAVCCSFNYYAIDSTKAITPEGSSEPSETPRRVASCGYQTALTVLLETSPEDYYSASVASQGALVFIDNAFNIADLDSPVRLVNPETEVLIALSPESTYTTAGVRTFKPAERQCYYNDEMEIGSFRQYSFHNCMAFQRVDYIKNICDCVPYYFPVKDYHRTCNFNDLDCLQSLLGPNRNRTSAEGADWQMECLPECEHNDYPLEVALGKLANNMRLEGLPFFSDVRLENHSLVNVFFNDLVSTRYRRDVYLNWQNLLASFGGLLSLMLGFTLISGFDLILFFTFGMMYGSLCSNSVGPDNTATKKPTKIYVQHYYNTNVDNFKRKKLPVKELTKIPSGIHFGLNSNRY